MYPASRGGIRSEDNLNSETQRFKKKLFKVKVLVWTHLKYKAFQTSFDKTMHTDKATCVNAHIRAYTYLPTYLPAYLPVYPPTYLPTHLHTHPPTDLPAHQPTYLPTTDRPTYPPTYPSAFRQTAGPTGRQAGSSQTLKPYTLNRLKEP